jgi:hypothetical protein
MHKSGQKCVASGTFLPLLHTTDNYRTMCSRKDMKKAEYYTLSAGVESSSISFIPPIVFETHPF